MYIVSSHLYLANFKSRPDVLNTFKQTNIHSFWKCRIELLFIQCRFFHGSKRYKSKTPSTNLNYLFAKSGIGICLRRNWRYQRGNQNSYIKEGHITQWHKEKVQKDKQRSTKHTHKIKDRVTRAPLKPGVISGAPERESSSCSTSGTRRVNKRLTKILSQHLNIMIYLYLLIELGSF